MKIAATKRYWMVPSDTVFMVKKQIVVIYTAATAITVATLVPTEILKAFTRP